MENKINLGIRHLTDIIYYSIMKDKKITFTECSTILYDLKIIHYLMNRQRLSQKTKFFKKTSLKYEKRISLIFDKNFSIYIFVYQSEDNIKNFNKF